MLGSSRVNDHEMILIVFQCNQLEILLSSFEESHKSKIGSWLDVDGSDLMSIQSIVVLLLNNCILHEEKRTEFGKMGLGMFLRKTWAVIMLAQSG